MKKSPFAGWRANFVTGLAVIPPATVFIALLVSVFVPTTPNPTSGSLPPGTKTGSGPVASGIHRPL